METKGLFSMVISQWFTLPKQIPCQFRHHTTAPSSIDSGNVGLLSGRKIPAPRHLSNGVLACIFSLHRFMLPVIRVRQRRLSTYTTFSIHSNEAQLD